MPDREQLKSLSADEKRKLLAQVLRQRGTTSLSPGDGAAGFQPPPEFLAMKAHMQELEQAAGGIYFQEADGLNAETTLVQGRVLTNYASYNYLGMSGDPVVSQAAKDAIDRYGTSVSASRLVSGERPLHRELEQELARLLGAEACLVFVGGFGTNETVIGRLVGPGDLVLYDSLIHSSIQEGSRLSGARVRVFPHNNCEALDQLLHTHRREHQRALIVIEGVYSMDGDIPDLPRFIEVKQRHRAMLMVDEAHSIGVLGRHGGGIGEHFDVDRNEVEVWMGTLSKSLAACGGYIAGSQQLVEYVKFTTPGFVYSVGMSPPNAAAALAALHQMRSQPERLTRLRARADLFLELARQRGLNTGPSRDSAVVPVIVGSSQRAVQLYRSLNDAGILAFPIMHPTVPENTARLRFFLSCTHSEEQIRHTIRVIADSLPVPLIAAA
jgi:8-amino-7-oxononanoate synthase